MVTLKPKARDAVFRAIADPTRRHILGLLRRRSHAVGEIAGHFRTSRPAVSKHIRVLRNAGLITVENQGTARICRLNAAPLRTVGEWLRDYQALWDDSLKRYVEEDHE